MPALASIRQIVLLVILLALDSVNFTESGLLVGKNGGVIDK